MNKQLVCLPPYSPTHYEIEIGWNSLTRQADYLHSLASRVVIVTDDKVMPIYGEPLKRALSNFGLKVDLFFFSHGEQNKTRKTKEDLENQLFEKKIGRDTCLIALGGGVVTDLAGYLAATYCRGISLVMMPTTLLGMADASIGGKTGVNVPEGKNMIGCFYPPKKVIIDPSTLQTLSQQELKNGFVEIIKHGLIADKPLFEFLEQNKRSLFSLEQNSIDTVIFESCRIKKEIVEQDEKEKGKRYLLNFGHTIGHALERLTTYTLPHGEAVAIGLCVESYLSFEYGLLNQASFQRIFNLLIDYAHPLKLPVQFSIDSILEAMTLDKKSLNGQPRFVIIKHIGSPFSSEKDYCHEFPLSLVKKALKWMNDALYRD